MRGSRGFSTMPLVVKNLIIINALFFLARYTFGSIASTDLNDTLGLYYFKSPEFNVIKDNSPFKGFRELLGSIKENSSILKSFIDET